MLRRQRESSEVMFASVSGLSGPRSAPQRRLHYKKMKPLNRKHLAQEAEQTSKVSNWPRKPAGHRAWGLETKTREQRGRRLHLCSHRAS